MRLLLLMIAGLTLLIATNGCGTTKLPAGDVDIYTRYKHQVATLHNPKLSCETKEKYEAAKILADNVDFSFLREVRTLEKIFGAKDAIRSNRDGMQQQLLFYYRYKDKSIRFVFWRHNNVVIKYEIAEK